MINLQWSDQIVKRTLSTSSMLIREFTKFCYNKKLKSERETCNRDKAEFFTKKGYGSKLLPEYERIVAKLQLPGFITKILRNQSSQDSSDNDFVQAVLDMEENFCEDQVCILPSFYNFLSYLKNNKINFSLVIRTFGRDLPIIVTELDQYFNKLFQWKSSSLQWSKRHNSD